MFSPNAGKYGPGKTPYLDSFHAAIVLKYSYFSRSYLLLTLSEKFHTKKNLYFKENKTKNKTKTFLLENKKMIMLN